MNPKKLSAYDEYNRKMVALERIVEEKINSRDDGHSDEWLDFIEVLYDAAEGRPQALQSLIK